MIGQAFIMPRVARGSKRRSSGFENQQKLESVQVTEKGWLSLKMLAYLLAVSSEERRRSSTCQHRAKNLSGSIATKSDGQELLSVS